MIIDSVKGQSTQRFAYESKMPRAKPGNCQHKEAKMDISMTEAQAYAVSQIIYLSHRRQILSLMQECHATDNDEDDFSDDGDDALLQLGFISLAYRASWLICDTSAP